MPALVMNCAVIGESHSPNSHTVLPAAVIFNPCVKEKGRPSFLGRLTGQLSGAERANAQTGYSNRRQRRYTVCLDPSSGSYQ